MATDRLDRSLEKSAQILSQVRSSLGNPRAVAFLNELMDIQRYVQDNAKEIKNLVQARNYLSRVREAIGMPSPVL